MPKLPLVLTLACVVITAMPYSSYAEKKAACKTPIDCYQKALKKLERAQALVKAQQAENERQLNAQKADNARVLKAENERSLKALRQETKQLQSLYENALKELEQFALELAKAQLAENKRILEATLELVKAQSAENERILKAQQAENERILKAQQAERDRLKRRLVELEKSLKETRRQKQQFLTLNEQLNLKVVELEKSLKETRRQKQQVTKEYELFKRRVADTKTRFIDNGNATVTDILTGLVWLQKANCFGEKAWKEALRVVQELKSGRCGLKDGSKAGDWRLPTLKEWQATKHKKYGYDPILKANAEGTFSGVLAGGYWSADNAENAWSLFLLGGHVHFHGKTSTLYVWPVRRRQ